MLSPGVQVGSWSRVERSVILHNSRVSRYAVVENAILDKNVVVMEGATLGVDKEHDRARGFVVSGGGVTVVGKGQVVTPERWPPQRPGQQGVPSRIIATVCTDHASSVRVRTRAAGRAPGGWMRDSRKGPSRSG